MRWELAEVKELAEYRARLIQRMPAGPVSVRPQVDRVEAPSYLKRLEARKGGEGS